MVGIVWFREDLRIHDNPALFFATEKSTLGVVGVYIIDAAMWLKHDMAPCRVDFLLRGLRVLSDELKNLNIPLLIHQVNASAEIPGTLYKIIKEVQANFLFYNRQYELDELRRDQQVEVFLKKEKISCHGFDDQVILPPGSVKNQQDEYFKVFTAYKNRWYQQFENSAINTLLAPKKQPLQKIVPSPVPEKLSEFFSTIDVNLWPAGETVARERLTQFIEKNLATYDKTRDFPALNSTSHLSPYLSTGMISARECFLAALRKKEKLKEKSGAMTWMNELIWRDFYKHILVAAPRVSMGKAYQLRTEKIAWEYNEKHYQAWQEGKTGFPIIDAAMRQLNTTGWMHNRLRMVTAQFLAKNLLLNWRWGEKYFMTHLIDGDLAANNGGWQWCASTGTDAAPYFRVFNPISQSEKFDPHGDFIRQFCPELSHLDKKSIHAPYEHAPLLMQNIDYPSPLVDLKITRQRAIEVFKNIA